MMLGERPRDPAHQPSDRGLKYFRVGAVVEFGAIWVCIVVVAASVALIAEFTTRTSGSVFGALLVVLVVLLAWFAGVLPPLAVRFRRYEVGENALFVQRGFFSRRRAIVPFERVQYVIVTRGPVERRFRLATVALQTSAGSESIAMLDDDVADELERRISALTRRSAHDI